MSATQTIPNPFIAAGRWFLGSGIQEDSGGVARYYRADLGQNAPISTEITGYAVSALSYLYERTQDREYLNAARHAADYLLTKAWDSDLEIFRFEPPRDQAPTLAYFFDTGIIVRGLLALWRITADQALFEAAVRGGESLGKHFRAGQDYHPILRLPSLEPVPRDSQWSKSPGCYQLKSAMAWLDLSRATGRSDFRRLYEDALSRALETYRSFLPADTPATTMDRLHAFTYFLEAVLPVADRSEVETALRTGIDLVAGYLREIRSEFERSDVYAQLVRVRLIVAQRGVADLDRPGVLEEVSAIPKFQTNSTDVRLRGGYAFGRKQGELIPHSNPVSTSFCLQALEMWKDFESGHTLDVASLI